jgi:adenosylhomocysteine nucleosidase
VSAILYAAAPVIAVTGLAIEARIAAGPGVQTVVGGGYSTQLAIAIEREIDRGAGAIISFGIAGGLTSDAVPGKWIVARHVIGSTSRWTCDPVWTQMLSERLPGALVCDVAGVDEPVLESERKRALHLALHTAAVDTESHIAARIASAHGLPFAVFRVVADPAQSDLPAVAAKSLRDDGTVDLMRVFRSLARTPRQIPGLLRTAVDAGTALRALSRGRRLLGSRLGLPDLDELRLHVS